MAEQRYQAVLAVIGEGRSVSEVAVQWRVDRRKAHRWLGCYEVGGLEGLADRSHKPLSCPHQMTAQVEALVLELRSTHRYWGARRLVLTSDLLGDGCHAKPRPAYSGRTSWEDETSSTGVRRSPDLA